MYYVIYQNEAIGPFNGRNEAYSYMAAREIGAENYAVKSDAAMQQAYLHLPIRKPAPPR
jgi:hypothetical protein